MEINRLERNMEREHNQDRWPLAPQHDGDLWAVIVENPHLPTYAIVTIGLSDSFDTALNLAYREAEMAGQDDIAALVLEDVDEEADKTYENGDGVVFYVQKVGVYVR